jgi:SAM-dependent methyltransferase
MPESGQPGKVTPAAQSAELHERLRDAMNAVDAQDAAFLADAVAFLSSNPNGFIEEISPDDRMHRSAAPYFPAGRAALRFIRLAMLEAGRHDFESILDFGCGFGRVLRMLRAAFPEASLTACDLRTDGVDFCVRAFGATPAYSSYDPKHIRLEGPFDLIWCGSVFTHFDDDQWAAFLPFFESLLAPKGLLVFTTMGRYGADILRSHDTVWGISQEGIQEMLQAYEQSGFGFSSTQVGMRRGPQGVSLSKPSWVFGQIEKIPGMRLVSCNEGVWGPQDVVGCAVGPFTPSLGFETG